MAKPSAVSNARFIRSQLHEQGTFPNYEDVLEVAYRLFLTPGQKVIDIGAHTGRHAEHFIDIVGARGKVWCFEPLPPMERVLQSRFGSLSNVTIERLAFSNKVGETSFIYVTNAPEESGLKERIYNVPDPIQETITVRLSTVDSYFPDLTGVDYVKIDIEGGEIDCLDGMQDFLARNRPFMSVEYGFPAYSKYGNSAEALYDQADRFSMTISDMFGAVVHSRQEWLDVCDVATWDYFLVPNERVDEWASHFSATVFPDTFLGKVA